ncbi:MAG TPA: GntR family transcriptional regulator [Candidatus Thioglobus sp.]|jgi:DNA-binding GntR family transcriptional regulator|nr:GntR family transcriptional regulator [Candidatus Thioglobus sp.]
MKKEHFSQDLKRKILTLKLAPGATLNEISLSKEYDISRTPLREIFQRLAGEGYIEIINNRGAIVSPMDYKNVRNLFITAPMIYSSISRLATEDENATREQLSELQDVQDSFRKAVKQQQLDSIVLHNDRFHRLIGKMANNPYLQLSYERLLIDHTRINQTFYRATDAYMTANLEQEVDQHEAMIEYLAIGDVERMVALTQDHWNLSKAHMGRYMCPNPLPVDNNRIRFTD